MKIKQYKATSISDKTVTVIDFYDFQAAVVGAKLADGGMNVTDAKKLMKLWNTPDSAFKFEIVLPDK